MARPLELRRCHVCRQKSLRREKRPFEYEVSHDGRPPVRIRIPDLEVIVCTNPDCHPEHPDDATIEDDAAIWRITVETYRQLGLLTPQEIKAGRERLGLSQQGLAELLGLGGNSLSRWEKGRVYQSRSSDRLLRIVFEVPEALGHLKQNRRGEAFSSDRKRVKFQYLDIDGGAGEDGSGLESFTPAKFLAGSQVDDA
jgi:putative zinc finger/helix-turn-helix YgiT family protein